MKGADWSSAVLVLAGWWGGRCQKASLDSREEAVNSSSPGSLSDLNTNTDVPLILVQPYIPSLAPFPFLLLLSLVLSHTRLYRPPPLLIFSNAISSTSSSLVQYVALFVPPILFGFFFFFVCLAGVFVVAVSVSEAEQSLITGKRTQRRKQTPQGGSSLILLRKTLFSTHSTERDVETGAQVLRRVQ